MTDKPKSKTAAKYSRPSDAKLRAQLSPLAFRVTQCDATEPPFDNAYHDEKRAGIYVDAISGAPLFSSRDKFDSGTGWPSFTKPLVAEHITEKPDYKLMQRRVEARGKHSDAHLGHIFEDGPKPKGLRYCINSAALRFIPAAELAANGYAEYEKLCAPARGKPAAKKSAK